MTLYYKTEDEKYLPVETDVVPIPKDNEFLLVRLGDPLTGWIPSQSELEAVAEFFGEMMPGKHDCAFFYHYGINLEVLSIPKTPTLLVLGIGDRVSGYYPEQTECDTVEAEFKKLLEAYPNVKIKAVSVYTKPLVQENIESEKPATT
jgi:hypothetical protein